MNTEPVVGAQLPRSQKLQWFLSESEWDERTVQTQRLQLLREGKTTASNGQGVLLMRREIARQVTRRLMWGGNIWAVSEKSMMESYQFPAYGQMSRSPIHWKSNHTPPEKSFPKGKNDPAFARNSKWPGNWPKGLLSKDGLSVPLWQIISTERIAV